MNETKIKIQKVTIAATNIAEMAYFYNTIFNCGFKERNAYGTKLYSGKLGEIVILLCPNEIAQVDAKQNRQQFDILVKNIPSLLEKSSKCGGVIKENFNPTTKTASIIDPDGNTIVLIENND